MMSDVVNDNDGYLGQGDVVSMTAQRQFASPAQAAAIVEAAIERWATPFHLHFLEGFARDIAEKDPTFDGSTMFRTLRGLGGTLMESPIYALTEEPTALIQHGATTWQPQPLLRSDVPTLDGIAIFQFPLHTMDRGGRPFDITAMSWTEGMGRIRGSEGAVADVPGLVITFFTKTDDVMDVARARAAGRADVLAAYQRRADTLPPLSLLQIAFVPFEDQLALADDLHGVAIWKFLFSMWAFVQQEVVIADDQPQPRPIRRRAQREGRPDPPTLRVIRLRRQAAHTVQPSDTPHHVEWRFRWVVRGHWRNQFFARSQTHRQIWIYPFVKGPEDKPLRDRKTVFNVTR